MKNTAHQMDEKLFAYIDGNLSDNERQKLEAQLLNDEMLRIRLQQLRVMDNSLKEFKGEHPSWNFTDRVMLGVDQYASHKNLSMQMGLLLLSGILIVTGIASMLASSGVFDGWQTYINLNDLTFSKHYFKLSMPTFTIRGKLMINTIILINLIFAFIILDRVVLKPFFRKRLEM
jgi:anti-sigma factor RsiW